MERVINFCAGTNTHNLPAKNVDAILVNVPHNAFDKNSMDDTKFMFKYADVKWSQLDCGGFQFAEAEKHGKEITLDPTKPAVCSEKKLNLTTKHVFKDAAPYIKPTIANALDFPIGKFTDPNDRQMEFMRKLGFNVIWAKECSILRQEYCPDVKLFLPIQCYDLKQFDIFMDLIGDISFDGFSIPTRNFNVKEIALFLVKFLQSGKKEAHILGTTAFFIIALAAYMRRNLFDWVSVDATTWRQSAQYSVYLNPHDLSPEYLGNVIIDETDDNNDCECPWCKDRSFTYIKNLPDPERTAFLRCHNFWVIEEACKNLYRHSNTVIDLERYLKRKSPATDKIDELINTLALVDAFKDEDIRVLEQMLLGP